MPARDDRHEALRQRVEHWSKRLHVPAPRVRVRDMTRKWGSCSTSGTITLATDLSHQEVGFQDFVIATSCFIYACLTMASSSRR